MKTARWKSFLLLAVTVGVAGCNPESILYGPNAKVRKAEGRLTAVINGMNKNDDYQGDLQAAICEWNHGAPVMTLDGDFDKAWNDFDNWMRAKSLYGKKIESFEIVESTLVPESEPATVSMTVKINGREHSLLIPEGAQIRWAK
jgi:hypothetical protein